MENAVPAAPVEYIIRWADGGDGQSSNKLIEGDRE